jgi:hypothetical protein
VLSNASMLLCSKWGEFVSIFIRESDDVADLDTLLLPASSAPYELTRGNAQRVEHEATTCVDVVSMGKVLPIELHKVPVARSAMHLQNVYCDTIIMEMVSTGELQSSIHIVPPTEDLTDTLETIKHLCEQFVKMHGILPSEIALHWLVCLQLLADGHNCIYGRLCNGTECPKEEMVRIPFVTSIVNREDMIVVRGETWRR